MKYYVIAGEASGDLHGSNLLKALKERDEQAQFRVWGGDLMEAAGGQLVKHYRDLAFMGFVEVVANLRTILRNISFCKKDVLTFAPDVLILIDYPGFNLRIAKWAKRQNIRVFYYISPQIWAWRQSRVHKIKRSVDRMFVILPFEKDFYAQYDMAVDFVGHPLMDAIENLPPATHFLKEHQLDQRPIIALLPGSRQQEIKRMLPLMLSVVDSFPDYQFIIGGAPSQPRNFYQQIIDSQALKNLPRFVSNETYPLLQSARAALVTSGTATLETALFHVPQVVLYRGNWWSYQIAKRLVKVKYISLVNLIMDREVVTELIQQDCKFAEIVEALNLALNKNRKKILSEYNKLQKKLAAERPSQRAASLMYAYLNE